MKSFNDTLLRLLAVVVFGIGLFFLYILFSLMLFREDIRMLVSVVNIICIIINISIFIALINGHKKLNKSKDEYMV